MDWLNSFTLDDWIELIAMVLSLLYLYLEVKEKSLLWFVGIISSGLYAYVYFKTNFYADFGLMVYFVAISIYGWINWSKGGIDNKGKELPIKRISANEILLSVVFGAAIYGLLLLVLLYLPGYIGLSSSSFPYVDSFTVAANIVGTWLLTRKVLEQWYIWIVVNFVCIIMYWLKGLNFTTFLFVVYTIGSVIGYFNWLRLYKQQIKEVYA